MSDKFELNYSVDIDAIKRDLNTLAGLVSNNTKNIEKDVKSVSSSFKEDYGKNIRGASTQTKVSSEEMGVATGGLQLDLSGVIQTMQLLGSVSKNILTGFINASPLASVEIAKMQFQFKLLQKEMGDVLAPALEKIGEIVIKAITWFSGLSDGVKQATILMLALTVAGVAVAGVIAIISAVGLPLIAIVAGIALGVALLFLAFKTNFLGINDIVMDVFGVIKGLIGDNKGLLKDFGKAVKDLYEFLKPILKVILQIFKATLIVAIKLVAVQLKSMIKGFILIINLVKAIVKGDWKAVWGLFKQAVTDQIDNIKAYVKIFADFIKQIFTAVGGNVTSFINILKKLINAPIDFINVKMIDKLNVMLRKIKEISILGAKPFDFIKTFPHIPKFHTGGIVNQDGVYQLNKGEAVIPQSQTTSDLRGVGGGGSSGTIIIQQVIINNNMDLDEFTSKLRSKNFETFTNSGYSFGST